MNFSAKVSVIVPIYRVEKYIHQCIDSIICQDYDNMEIILVDDGSPDTCPAICDEYAKKDSRITVIHKANGGLGLARNSGLSIATGDYICFVDSDDWIDQGYISRYVALMEEYDAVIQSFKFVTSDGKTIRRFPLIDRGGITQDEMINRVVIPLICAPPSNPKDDTLPVGAVFKMYKASLIKKYNLQFISEKECLAEDIFFNTEYFVKCNSVFIAEEYGYNYRMNPKSISNTYTKERAYRGFEYYRKLTSICKKLGIYDVAKLSIQRSYIGKCRVALKLIVNSRENRTWKKKEILRILTHPVTIEALDEYPIKTYSIPLRITAYAMKSKSIFLVMLCFQVRKLMGKVN